MSLHLIMKKSSPGKFAFFNVSSEEERRKVIRTLHKTEVWGGIVSVERCAHAPFGKKDPGRLRDERYAPSPERGRERSPSMAPEIDDR